MSRLNLELSRADVQAYARANQYATMMFFSAGDDYVASRCLILNALGAGFGLFAQSVEKLLKACIFLETGNKTKLKGLDKHDPYKLKQELQAKADYSLDKYDNCLKNLFGHFQRRYFDNKDQSKGASSTELEEFDELWLCLLDKIPIPVEVKYRLKFLADLFDEVSLEHLPSYRYWATLNNKAIAGKMQQMEETYIAVKKHLYP
jgi:hypothetical protein